jgi:hypothetical protein
VVLALVIEVVFQSLSPLDAALGILSTEAGTSLLFDLHEPNELLKLSHRFTSSITHL